MKLQKTVVIAILHILYPTPLVCSGFFKSACDGPLFSNSDFPKPELLFPVESSKESQETVSMIVSFLEEIDFAMDYIPAPSIETKILKAAVHRSVKKLIKQLQGTIEDARLTKYVDHKILVQALSTMRASLGTVQETTKKLKDRSFLRISDLTDIRIALNACNTILNQFTDPTNSLARDDYVLWISPHFMNFMKVYIGLIRLCRLVWPEDESEYTNKSLALLTKLGVLRDQGLNYRMGLVFKQWKWTWGDCYDGCVDDFKHIHHSCQSCNRVECGDTYSVEYFEEYFCSLLQLYRDYYEKPFEALKKQIFLYAGYRKDTPRLSKFGSTFPVTVKFPRSHMNCCIFWKMQIR